MNSEVHVVLPVHSTTRLPKKFPSQAAGSEKVEAYEKVKLKHPNNENASAGIFQSPTIGRILPLQYHTSQKS